MKTLLVLASLLAIALVVPSRAQAMGGPPGSCTTTVTSFTIVNKIITGKGTQSCITPPDPYEIGVRVCIDIWDAPGGRWLNSLYCAPSTGFVYSSGNSITHSINKACSTGERYRIHAYGMANWPRFGTFYYEDTSNTSKVC